MRIPCSMLVLLALAGPAHAGGVGGYCERDGKRVTFSDGIAFADARKSDGTVTTTIYFTARPLDRGALAACAACAAAPGESTFTSPRRDAVEAQRSATADGWMEIAHTAGELELATIVNLMYLAPDGTLTGLDGGNGQVAFTTRNAAHVSGKVTTEAREPPMNETDMTCDVSFDLAVGWPTR
ncbi:hypothetical protein [Dokdonella sp.]|uniref:hypothetical protein n=1 Tax=Dokdonella sp. TaxID=2291710 RepID=UPI002F3FB90F